MTTLQTIIDYKKKEVQEKKDLYPIKLLERSIYFQSPTLSLKKNLEQPQLSGIIAEFKRQSPSKGAINKYADVEHTTMGYHLAGAIAISVLTDAVFFGGKNSDLTTARNYSNCPILRKDFIIDEYQLIEAKSIGADAILLIAAALTKEHILELTRLASDLRLEVLLEVHEEPELDKIIPGLHIAGVNNRNLRTMDTSLQTSIDLAGKLPRECLKVAESGINSAQQVVQLKKQGFDGFLIGEQFMKKRKPEQACKAFIGEIKTLQEHTIEL